MVLDNVSFRLTILFPSHSRDDVAAALWAWETFGGIGARTRRGFGALRCLSLQENQQPLVLDLPLDGQQQARKWIEEKLFKYVVDGTWVKAIPHLQKQAIEFEVVTKWGTHDPWSIWNKLIDALKNFRQSRFSSTKQNARHPGRSEWPEPSGIRKWTGQTLIGHNKTIPDPHINKFPRAAFGLPIIFQFKDRNKHQPADKKSDPRKTVLQLADTERFASPLILKPLACQNDTFVGLALLLEGTRVEDFQLLLKTQERPDDEVSVESVLSPGEALVITSVGSLSPVRVDSQTNALQAFLKYLRSITK
jgi:CRISPR-associated protein Cmr1